MSALRIPNVSQAAYILATKCIAPVLVLVALVAATYWLVAALVVAALWVMVFAVAGG